ncbi:MAG: hypothetical protein MUP16_03635, partial [Sedimentisphaerales bacterium]|nr:hypothetical protein [Sedimentisphaerales bacterium]
ILLIFPVVFGVRGVGPQLAGAGVIAKFKEATGNKAKESESQVSPLVKQAEAFALYMNPPPKPKPVVQAPPVTPEIRPPAPVSPKFKLFGTSVYQTQPEMSLAFIDEPGKGLHWVKQSGEVGHLIIEQVKDGSVVVRDGQRTFEIVAEPRPVGGGINLLEGAPSGATPIENIGASPVLVEPSASVVSTPPPPQEASEPPPSPEVIAEGKAALNEFIAELASLQKGSKSDKNGSADSNEEKSAAAMEKLIGDLKATRVSAEEAKKLNGLGKELESVQRDPNLPPPTPSPKSSRPVTRVRRPIRPPNR